MTRSLIAAALCLGVLFGVGCSDGKSSPKVEGNKTELKQRPAPGQPGGAQGGQGGGQAGGQGGKQPGGGAGSQ